MKKSSLAAQKTNKTVCKQVSQMVSENQKSTKTHLVGVVQVQEPTAALVDILVTGIGASHGQGGIHMNVVAREVEGEEHLENNGPSRERARQENKQARSGAPISDHVEDGTEARRLLESARGVTVEGIQKAGHAV